MQTQFLVTSQNSEEIDEGIRKDAVVIDLNQHIPINLEIVSPLSSTLTVSGFSDSTVAVSGYLTGNQPETHLGFQPINAMWDDYSGYSNLLQKYNRIKHYEEEYKTASKQLFEDWQKGKPVITDTKKNDWLMTYLQIKDFVNE
jgi:hypothetical protein